MRVRLVAATMVLVLSACAGGTPASNPPSTAAAGPGGSGSAAPVGSGAVVDLSGVDACALLTMETVEALTGETGFVADDGDKKCFWAVPRPGVPQYVEINVFPRPGGLGGYTFNPGPSCTSAPVPGIGSEAFGGTCTDAQKKVFLVAWDRGVAVQILVNEPEGPLDPVGLAAAARSVLDGLD